MIANPSVPRVEQLLPLLACLECQAPLELQARQLRCSHCAARYPLRDGRPIFLEDPAQVRVMPASHVSNQLADEILDWLTWLDGYALNLGAGGTLVKLPHCIEVEYSIFRHTDVVADAHHLPFGDSVFDAVVTFNTFEHLRDPVRAAREIYRVLKPGGRLILRTAFLQPVHEAPYHFYNTTEYGLRRWFQDFDISKVFVSDNFSPAYVLAWLSSAMLSASAGVFDAETVRRLAQSPLEFWKNCWEAPATRSNPLWKLLGELPQELQSQFAAGFQLEATKPATDERWLTDGTAAATTTSLPSAARPVPALTVPVRNGSGAPANRSLPSASMATSNRAGSPRIPNPERFRVVFVIKPGVLDAASTRYRAFNVIEAMGLKGIEADWVDVDEVPERLGDILAYDLVILTRRPSSESLSRLLDAAKAAAVPVIFDIDDYIFDKEVIGYVEFFRKFPECMTSYRMVLERCPYFTGATGYLVDKATAIGKKSFWLRNGLNSVQVEVSRRVLEQKAQRPADGKVRIGYFSGTRTHQADFRLVAAVLLRLLQEFPDLDLYVAGDFDLEEFHEFTPYRARIATCPFLDWRELPAEIGKVDINLIPLEINVFSQGKSDLKYYEAGLLKIPSVASPSSSVAQSITHGVNGMIARTPEDWYDCLCTLLRDKALRQRLGENAYQHVVKTYVPAAIADQAQAVYQQVIEHHRAALGASAETLSVVILLGDVSQAMGTYSPAVTLAAEWARLGTAVTLHFLENHHGHSPAQALQLLANHFADGGYAVEIGGAIPCCDLLLATDAGTEQCAREFAKRARRTGRLIETWAPVTPSSPTSRPEADKRSVEPCLKLVPLNEAVSTTNPPSAPGGAIPLWAEAAEACDPPFGPQKKIVCAVDPQLSPDALQAVSAALTRLHQRHPEVEMATLGAADALATILTIPHRNLGCVPLNSLRPALADRPICLVCCGAEPPRFAFDFLGAGCPIVMAIEPEYSRHAAWSAEAGVLTTTVNASAIADKLESLLHNPVLRTALMQRGWSQARRLPTASQAARSLLASLHDWIGATQRPRSERDSAKVGRDAA